MVGYFRKYQVDKATQSGRRGVDDRDAVYSYTVVSLHVKTHVLLTYTPHQVP